MAELPRTGVRCQALLSVHVAVALGFLVSLLVPYPCCSLALADFFSRSSGFSELRWLVCCGIDVSILPLLWFRPVVVVGLPVSTDVTED